MTIHTQFLTRAFIALFIFTGQAFAKDCNDEFKILKRNKRNTIKFTDVKLEGLKCNGTFETEDFKIVYQKNENAIDLNSDEELSLRAANVLYHLTKAKKFWTEEMNSEFVKDLGQITVRIQITNGFSRLGHFTNDNYVENVNNAWTIPAGETSRWDANPHAWGKEIWFSPMKKIESRNLVTSSGNNPVTDQLNNLRVPIINYTENSLIQNTIDHLAYPEYQDTTLLQMATTHLGTMAVMFGIIEMSKKMDKLFMNKYYYLDTAMVPDVIYHEFSHVALSDHLEPIHSVAVIEGMADYFATRIAGVTKTYDSIKTFTSAAIKNARDKKYYSPYFESSNNAHSDFTLSLLYKLYIEINLINDERDELGIPHLVNADTLIYEARKYMTPETSILEMTHALHQSATSGVCDNKRQCVGAVNKAQIDKGI
tara:strand:+ start:2647 stop:3921 length:1275 start_codon:yes stop_codon:yes gene_type:complete